LELDDITGVILDASLRIHREIGPGLLESLYVGILAGELRRRGLRTERERLISFSYDGTVARTPSAPISSCRSKSSSR
jgi:iron complex transport system substrate-binding protein